MVAHSRPLRLAYVTTVAITQWAFLRGQNRFLSERGFEIHSISSPGEYLSRLSERDGTVPHAVHISRTISPLADLVSLCRLYLLFRRINPDIVHVSTPKAALLGAIAAWAAHVPIRIYLLRGSITEGATGVRRRLFRFLEWLTAKLCHQTICVAPSLRDFARTERILGPDGGFVAGKGMSNGIDLTRFDPDTAVATSELPAWVSPTAHWPDPVLIGFVGRLARDKGIEELATAWVSIREEFPSSRLLLVGPWEAENPISAQSRRTLEDDLRVHFTGSVEDVVPFYRLMSLFVFPSYGTEGFPNAPMEAAAMRLPVIATRVVGCVDAVVEGRTGTLVAPRDAAGLTVAIRQYLTDPSLRRTHGHAGRERVLVEFQQEMIWEMLYQEYARLVGLKSGPAAELQMRSPRSHPTGTPVA